MAMEILVAGLSLLGAAGLDGAIETAGRSLRARVISLPFIRVSGCHSFPLALATRRRSPCLSAPFTSTNGMPAGQLSRVSKPCV